MPSWKSFDVFGEATDQIAQTAVKAINARRQERQREAAFQNLRSYLGQRFNKPAAAPKQPGLGPQGEAPAQLNEGATAGRNVQPEISMLESMNLAPADVLQRVEKRYTPRYEQFAGAQGELDQYLMDAETGAADPLSRTTLRGPLPPRTAARALQPDVYDDPRDNTRYRITYDPTSGVETGRSKMGPTPPKAGRAAGGEASRDKAARTYKERYAKAAQTVNDMEKYYGEPKIAQWREELKTDQDAQDLLAHPETALPAGMDNTRAQKIQQLRNYEKALSEKNTSGMLLNGLGFVYDETTGELNPVNPKARRGAAQGPGTQAPPEQPKAGDVVDGYRFKGGDPSDQNSWEEVE